MLVCSYYTLVVQQVFTSPTTSACTLEWLQQHPTASDTFHSSFLLSYLRYCTQQTGNCRYEVIALHYMPYLESIKLPQTCGCHGVDCGFSYCCCIPILWTLQCLFWIAQCWVTQVEGKSQYDIFHIASHYFIESILYICRDGMLMVQWSALLMNMLRWQL